LALASFYYFLPAYFANMAPMLEKKFSFLKTPVDFSKEWRNKPIFGSHKTWGGLILAVVAGTFVFYLQKILYQIHFFQEFSIISYNEYSLFLGFLLSFGAIFGDLIKSFFKRRSGISPGKPWIPFDQLDFILGAFLFSFFVYIPPVFTIVVIIFFSPLLHILANHLAFYLKLKKTKW